jgi:O-antigen ligase
VKLIQAKMSTALERIIAGGLLVVMAFTTLAHGTVEPWSILLFELMVTALMLLWATKALFDKNFVLYVPPMIWPLVALFGLGVAQSIRFTGADGLQKSLSLDVEATQRVVLIIVCLIASGLIAANIFASSQFEKLAKWLTLYGLALALFAIIQHFTWNERFYWWRWNASYAPFGSFVNRNHFAGYMELLLPWPIVIMLQRWGRWQEQVFYGLAAVWMGVAAILTLSRGGMLSICMELVLIVLLSSRLRQTANDQVTPASRRKRAWLFQASLVLVVLVTIVSGVTLFGGQRFINRITTGQETDGPATLPAQTLAESRGGLWQAGWQVFLAYPLTGAGLGAYETAYSICNGENIVGTQAIVGHAHNDYLQCLTDGGIIGGMLALWFLLALVRAAKRGLRVRDPLYRVIAVACLTGMFGLLVHSLFDYNLQLPSHSLFFVVNASVLWRIGMIKEVPSIERTLPALVPAPATALQRSLL